MLDDAKGILRYRGITDMKTTLDISWPPKDQIRVTVDPAGGGRLGDRHGRGGRRPWGSPSYQLPAEAEVSALQGQAGSVYLGLGREQ